MDIVRRISRKNIANAAFFMILTALVYILSFNCMLVPNVIGEVVYSSRIDIPPAHYVAISINLNPGDFINGTFRSLATCVVEYCIDVAGFVLDLNNNVVAIFRINYTKPISRFSFGTLDGGTFRIILINLLTFEAYTELKLERVKGIYPTPPKVIIPTTTIYSTIMSTVTEKIPTTTTIYSTTTVEKTMAILLPTTIITTAITTIANTTTVITTLPKTYTVTQTQQSTITLTLSTTLNKTTTSTITIIGYETATQTMLLEVSKTMYVPITTTTTMVYTQSPSQDLVQILIGTVVILLVAVVGSAFYIINKIVRKK